MVIAKVPTSLRLTPQALTGLERLAQKRGLNRTAYLEILIRQQAAAEGIDVEDLLMYLDRRPIADGGGAEKEEQEAGNAVPPSPPAARPLANHKRNQQRRRK
jgi:hypothetical protein